MIESRSRPSQTSRNTSPERGSRTKSALAPHTTKKTWDALKEWLLERLHDGDEEQTYHTMARLVSLADQAKKGKLTDRDYLTQFSVTAKAVSQQGLTTPPVPANESNIRMWSSLSRSDDEEYSPDVIERPPLGISSTMLKELRLSHADGSTKRSRIATERCSIRPVVKGFHQKYGVDYDETFAPIALHDSFRTLLTLAAIYK